MFELEKSTSTREPFTNTKADDLSFHRNWQKYNWYELIMHIITLDMQENDLHVTWNATISWV